MKTVLVTGSANGIGKAVCEAFRAEGYRTIGVDLLEDPAADYETILFDISKLRRHDRVCTEFYERLAGMTEGRLDALVNNAAVQIVKPVAKVTASEWDRTLDTNLLAPFFLTQSMLPYLRKAHGCVINISSIHTSLTKREFTLYASSKGAMDAMTRALALELAPDVRVNAVVPAATDTQMLQDGFNQNMEGMKELGLCHPIGRIAKPEEVAQAALFLASERASFITGESLRVDGGIGACLHDPVQ